MSALVTQRCHRLAHSLAELKVKVRAALATELATAIGTAVRDVLVVALVDRLIDSPPVSPARPSSRTPNWRDDDYDRDRWGEPRDPWAEPDEYDHRDRTPNRYASDEPEADPVPAVPVAAAVTIGVQTGRWWLTKQGSVTGAIGFGILATGLGLAGGPVARAVLVVLAAATDILTAESALARIDLS